jgi:hypothetical protein
MLTRARADFHYLAERILFVIRLFDKLMAGAHNVAL